MHATVAVPDPLTDAGVSEPHDRVGGTVSARVMIPENWFRPVMTIDKFEGAPTATGPPELAATTKSCIL